jgi:hypothetical protein
MAFSSPDKTSDANDERTLFEGIETACSSVSASGIGESQPLFCLLSNSEGCNEVRAK